MKSVLTLSLIILSTTSLLAQNKKAVDSTTTKSQMPWVYNHDAADTTMRGYFLGTHKYPKNNLVQPEHVNRFQPSTDLFDNPKK